MKEDNLKIIVKTSLKMSEAERILSRARVNAIFQIQVIPV